MPLSYALSPVVNTVPAMLSSSAAVASSSSEPHCAMSPAPTSTGSPVGDASGVALGASVSAAGLWMHRAPDSRCRSAGGWPTEPSQRHWRWDPASHDPRGVSRPGAGAAWPRTRVPRARPGRSRSRCARAATAAAARGSDPRPDPASASAGSNLARFVGHARASLDDGASCRHGAPRCVASSRLPRMPIVGDVLAGRYRIDAPIGVGGMASVYRAADLRLERDVAVKVLLPNLAAFRRSPSASSARPWRSPPRPIRAS